MSVIDGTFSLSSAVQVVSATSADKPTLCEVHNMLGLSLLMTATSAQDDLTRWPLLARDAFIVAAGRALGLTIRDIHPPEAAIGVDQAVEFRQHFDASYAPLIRRALEHHQTVFAWQGWEGKAELCWGIITREDPRGIGFTGIPHPVDKLTDNGQHDQVIRRPPVQVYVVEELSGPRTSPNDCAALVINHAAKSLDPLLGMRFGVITGAPAYRRWAELAATADTDAQLTLVRSMLCGVDCFLQGVAATPIAHSFGDTAAAQLADYAQALRCVLSAVQDRLEFAAKSSSRVEAGALMADIGRATDLTAQTCAALRTAAPQPA